MMQWKNEAVLWYRALLVSAGAEWPRCQSDERNVSLKRIFQHQIDKSTFKRGVAGGNSSAQRIFDCVFRLVLRLRGSLSHSSDRVKLKASLLSCTECEMETPAWLHYCLHSMNRNHMFGGTSPR